MSTITATPGQTFEATLDGASDLAGALTVGIYDSPDELTAFYGPSSTGIVENPADSGLYAVELTAPEVEGTYSIVWSDGVMFARDILVVVAEGTGVAVKIDKTMYSIGPGRAVAVARNQPLYVLEPNGPQDRAVNLGTETLVEGFSDEALTVSLGTGPFESNGDGQYDVWVPGRHYDLYSPNDRTRPVTRWQPIAGGVPAAVAALSAQVEAFDGRVETLEDGDAAGNVAIGVDALAAKTTANNNVAIGVDALKANTSGKQNVAIGETALFSNATADDNVAVGFQALLSSTSAGNTAIGSGAAFSLTGGAFSTAIGTNALRSITTGSSNVAVGYGAGFTDGVTPTTANIASSLMLGNFAQATASNVAIIGGAISGARLSLCIGNTGDVGGGNGLISLRNAQVVPVSTYADGGLIYVEGGSLKYRGSSGTITTIAPA